MWSNLVVIYFVALLFGRSLKPPKIPTWWRRRIRQSTPGKRSIIEKYVENNKYKAFTMFTFFLSFCPVAGAVFTYSPYVQRVLYGES